jgi:hypothetical protein
MSDYPLNEEPFRHLISTLKDTCESTSDVVNLLVQIFSLPGFSATVDMFHIRDLAKYNDPVLNTAFRFWYNGVYGEDTFNEDYKTSGVYDQLIFL